MSASAHWRNEANVLAAEAESLQDTFSAWEIKVKQAVVLYRKALVTALDNDEKASASKNLGLISMIIARRYLTESTENERETLEMYKQGIKNVSLALEHGQVVKSQEWVENMRDQIKDAIDEANDMANREPLGKPRVFILQALMFVIPAGALKKKILKEIGDTELKNSVIALEKDDFLRGLECLRNCEQALVDLEASTITPDDYFTLEDIQKLKDEVQRQTGIGQSIQARITGDKMVDSALKDHEELPTVQVWAAIDKYTTAAVVCGTEIEIEARALIQMGEALFKILKKPVEARGRLVNAIQLLDTIPKQFNEKDWYKKALSMLESIQKGTVSEEEEMIRVGKLKILEALKPELKLIDEIAEDPKKLLEFIYDKYPPKCKETSIPPDYKTDTKKALKKTMHRYHPDTIDEETQGKRWKVLSEEICKRVTSHYENLKCSE